MKLVDGETDYQAQYPFGVGAATGNAQVWCGLHAFFFAVRLSHHHICITRRLPLQQQHPGTCGQCISGRREAARRACRASRDEKFGAMSYCDCVADEVLF